jgi:AraC-like DNA-binding protein
MMAERKIIPSFDLYKTLDATAGFEFSFLEESYNPYNAAAPHRHNYYEILFFNGSGGVHEIDFHEYPIEKNTLHFISPDQVHLLRRNKDVTGFVFSFLPEFFSGKNSSSSLLEEFPFFDHPYAMPIVAIRKDEQEQLMSLVSKMQTEYFSPHDDKSEALQSYLSLLLIGARRMYVPDEARTGVVRSHLAQEFKKIIGKNFRQQKSVAWYAGSLNISSGHLSDMIQKETGKTALELIHDRIILEAKRLFYHSPKSVKEIAHELGYEDPSYFARFFKTHTQKSPELFRRDIREKYQVNQGNCIAGGSYLGLSL